MQIWWYFAQLIVRIALISLLKVRVYGSRNVPTIGGLLVASNHQSYLDPILVGIAIDRELCFMARKSLFKNRLFATLISSLNAFPVERDYADLKGIRKSMGLLIEGEAVLIFPEGTRSRDGRIGKLKSGIGLLARRANVPIIPVLVEGSHKVWGRNNLLPSCGEINIIWGKPKMVDKDENVVEDLKKSFIELRQVIRRRI